MLSTHQNLQNSRLTFHQLGELCQYKSDLDKAGFTLEDLNKLNQASRRYGGVGKVLDATNTYTGLENIQTEAEKVNTQKKELEKQVVELKSKVETLTEQRAAIDTTLKLYDELRSIGFEKPLLIELRKASERYGDANSVLGAVNAYSNLKDMERTTGELQRKKWTQSRN